MSRLALPRLRPGAKVAVVAPSGPVPEEEFERGLVTLSSRYTVVYDRALLERQGFLAGTDERRFSELARAIEAPDVEAIVCARGGYGLLRLLPKLGPLAEVLRQRPKPIVGFSDVTLLLDWVVSTVGFPAIHGPVVTQLHRLPTADVESLWRLLEEDEVPPPMEGLRVLVPGLATGPLVGGNLEMLSRLCGTPFQASLRGKILLIEDVGERPYRIDRAVTHMRLAGALDGVAGIVLGDFTRCEEPPDAWPGPPSPTIDEVIVERLGSLGVPIVAGAPIGHGTANRAIPLGVGVALDGQSGRLTFLETLR